MIKKVSSFIASVLLCISAFMPLKVSAAATYFEIAPGTESPVLCTQNNMNITVSFGTSNSNLGGLRMVIATGYSTPQVVLATPSGGSINRNVNGVGHYINANKVTYQGIEYRWSRFGFDEGSSTGILPTCPASSIEEALPYLWGDNASGDDYSYGLADLGYTAQLAGGQQAFSADDPVNLLVGGGAQARNSRDVITWDGDFDNEGVPWSSYGGDVYVDIRVVPGNYSGDSKANLLTKTWEDFVNDVTGSNDVGSVLVTDGSFAISWAELIQEHLQRWDWTMLIPQYAPAAAVWRLYGWCYKVRVRSNSYTGDWETVYTATSSGAEAADTIVNNSTTYNQNLVQALQQVQNVNTTNNTTNNYVAIYNYTLNGLPISTDPQYTEPAADKKPWWAYLLDSIFNGIGKIVSGIGDLLSGIGDLFSGAFAGIPDIDLHFHEIGQGTVLQGPSDVVDALPETISDLPEQDFIVSYPGIEIMGVDFIPAGSYNLNEISDSLGIDHSLIYLATDAFVWSSLLVMIWKRIIGALRR